MMDELLNRVTQQTGLNPEQAKSAIDSVIAFLKERLPAPVASNLDSMLGGGGEGVAGRAAGVLGGIFGRTS